MNKSDSERISAYLEDLGYIKTEDRDVADLVVVTTCGVRQSAEDRVYGIIPKIKKHNSRSKIVLTGCLSKRPDVQKRLKKFVDIWLPIQELASLKDKLLTIDAKSTKIKDYLSFRPQYDSKISAFVPIGNGCDNFCTYCVVPHARGREVYRPSNDILNEVKELIGKNYKEITLIAQNVNSYKSGNINFPKLLKKVNDIPGVFWLRFATSHPKDMSNELIQVILECDKVCEYVHLPVQSGDNKILARMNRKYTVENYLKLVDKIREINKKNAAYNAKDSDKSEPFAKDANDIQITHCQDNYTLHDHKKDVKSEHKVCLEPVPGFAPENTSLTMGDSYWTTGSYTQLYQNNKQNETWIPPISITTDVIVGFPGETEEQFQNTVKLCQKAKFNMAYIGQYSPRPQTVAAKFKDNITKDEKKRRENELMKIIRSSSLEDNKQYIGKVVDVLVEGKNKKGYWFGKTRTMKKVKIKNPPAPLSHTGGHGQKSKCHIGDFVRVKITDVEDFGLEGEMR